MRPLAGHDGAVYCAAFAPDGRLASGGADGLVRVWDSHTGAALHSLADGRSAVHGVAFEPGGRWLVSTGTPPAGFRRSNTLSVWPGGPATLREGFDWRVVPDDVVTSPGFTANGRYLVACSRAAGGAARRWAVKTAEGEPLGRGLPLWAVYSVAVSPSGDRYVLGQDDSFEVLTRRNRIHGYHLEHPGPVVAVAFSPDGSRLATAGGSVVTVWRFEDRDGPILAGHDGEVRAVAFTPDGRSILTGGRDGRMALWDAATGRERTRYDFGLGPVHAVAVAPDGLTAAVAGDRGLVVFDLD